MYFRYGFYSEAVISISHMDSLPVEQADTDSKEILVDICQIRNIVGILAAGIGLYLIVCLLYHFFQLSECYFFIHRSFYFFTVFSLPIRFRNHSFFLKPKYTKYPTTRTTNSPIATKPQENQNGDSST